ncbi:hypothetical protein PIB30_020958 [Stylosanthes scabra]|uniref:Uncharacterized protein n=1 Tax=Stylosanthes scabra TaxID=79078 RepID=A0ABU6R969_9FABA|nr:hypothetical protein [Stylosanthes scabra]
MYLSTISDFLEEILMENLYGFHYTSQDEYHSYSYSHHHTPPPSPPFLKLLSTTTKPNFLMKHQQVVVGEEDDDEVSNIAAKVKVASHPLFPQLLHAYTDCQKVGATAEMVEQLDDTIIGIHHQIPNYFSSSYLPDPELDHFMEMYCNMLGKLKDEISRPFEEAKTFLNHMETKLNSIVLSNNVASSSSPSSVLHHATHNIIDNEIIIGSSKKCLHKENDDEKEINIINQDHQDLKGELLRRYSGYITNLKNEFSKNKKKERLPNEAKQILLAWWNIHFKWPYPTDADKVALAEWTGLDTKQINNWFINQRKRHWKPIEELETTIVLDGIYGPLCMTQESECQKFPHSEDSRGYNLE